MAEKHDQISYLNFFTKRERNDSEAGDDKTESGNEIPLPGGRRIGSWES